MKKIFAVALTLATLMFMTFTADAKEHYEYCPTCGGSGTVTETNWYGEDCIDEEVTCPECGGTGYIEVYYED